MGNTRSMRFIVAHSLCQSNDCAPPLKQTVEPLYPKLIQADLGQDLLYPTGLELIPLTSLGTWFTTIMSYQDLSDDLFKPFNAYHTHRVLQIFITFQCS